MQSFLLCVGGLPDKRASCQSSASLPELLRKAQAGVAVTPIFGCGGRRAWAWRSLAGLRHVFSREHLPGTALLAEPIKSTVHLDEQPDWLRRCWVLRGPHWACSWGRGKPSVLGAFVGRVELAKEGSIQLCPSIIIHCSTVNRCHEAQ